MPALGRRQWLTALCVGVALISPLARSQTAAAVLPGDVTGSLTASTNAVYFSGTMAGWSRGTLRIKITLYRDGAIVLTDERSCSKATSCSYPITRAPCASGETFDLIVDGFGPGALAGKRYQSARVSCPGTGADPSPLPPPAPIPRIAERNQTADYACRAQYTVTLERNPLSTRTIRFDFGDGSSTTSTIPAGTGTSTVSYSHTFTMPTPSTGSLEWTQTAMVAEGAAIGTDHSITRHDYIGP